MEVDALAVRVDALVVRLDAGNRICGVVLLLADRESGLSGEEKTAFTFQAVCAEEGNDLASRATDAAHHAHGAALQKVSPADAFEHFAHLDVLAQELVDLLHGGAGAFGDALAA